jgi:hypothetical protein
MAGDYLNKTNNYYYNNYNLPRFSPLSEIECGIARAFQGLVWQSKREWREWIYYNSVTP